MPTLETSEPVTGRTVSPAHAPPVVRRSALGCTKLRDSCHSCATSKIKCTKEKPSCSKCVARGIDCQYFFARRPGRRREDGLGHPTSCTSSNNSSRSSNSSSSPSSSSSSSSIPKSTLDRDIYSTLSLSGDTIGVGGHSPRHGYATNGTAPAPSTSLPASHGFLDIPQSLMIGDALTTDNFPAQYSSDLSAVLEDSNMFHLLSDFNPDPNDMDFSMTDYFENPVSFGLDSLDSNDPLSASFAVSSWVPSPASSVPTSSTTDPTMMVMRAPTTNISCSCVTQSLDLLKALSSAQSFPTSPISGAGPALSSSVTTMGSVQDVLIENKQHIETVSSLLSCYSCTEDAFRLVIVSMIVLKILERYASAARTQVFGSSIGSVETDTGPRSANSMIPSSNDQMRALSRSDTMPGDGSASGFAPAQLVLSELHRVQRLVNLLSPKLKGSSHLQVANEHAKTQSTPFSSNTLAQMESDVRKSLSSLSADIIDRLRQSLNE
ncbi:hypothetical protein Asppvi_011100 [Aspergillus pseudoviridinutans]|uniref:Zn(2)-C6 fungal-type domain-containing protein n=1 Tax=Aspergillus pseudoviridinutans TaxID=1517512 RepID=A0A9P3EXL9_9EURO|nr:uncharacterized protein Asppvi_011100 [Aspergillus pseudoviridinutans]GIJ92124.1 hypothetical protein Asppvi_011100 [Aspergillus pseudoviridinutans]